MKFDFSSVFFLLLLSVSISLSARSEVSEFEVEGIKVIYKKVPNEVVAVRWYVRGGTTNYPIELQGVENLAFELALFGGTEEISAEELTQLSQKYGMGLSSKSGYDYGYLGMTALKKFWDDSWNLWANALTNPAMNETAFNRIRDEVFARQRRDLSAPEDFVDELSMAYTYAGTDYEKLPAGNEGSLYDLTLESVKSHYAKVMTKSNCFLVVVGDISREDLIEKVTAAFSSLPAGEVRKITSDISVESPGATIVHRDLEINHIQGRIPAPGRYSEGGVENMMAMSLLSDRFAKRAQGDYDMAVPPSAYAGNLHRHPSNVIYVASASPRNSIDFIVHEINQIKNEGFSETELENKKPAFLTYHYLGKETLDAQAHALGDAEASGDWRWSEGLSKTIREMKLDSLNAVFRKHINWINWTYLGNSSQVQSSDFKQPDNAVKSSPKSDQDE